MEEKSVASRLLTGLFSLRDAGTPGYRRSVRKPVTALQIEIYRHNLAIDKKNAEKRERKRLRGPIVKSK